MSHLALSPVTHGSSPITHDLVFSRTRIEFLSHARLESRSRARGITRRCINPGRLAPLQLCTRDMTHSYV